MSRRKWSALVVGLLVLVLAFAASSRARSRNEPVIAAGSSPSAASLGLAGTASCSGRSCHGSLEPVPDKLIRQDEYTFWLSHDKHARAYQVLLEARARRMAENLAPLNESGRVIPAHEDRRCLACHTVPQAAQKGPDSEIVQETRRLGVGCEACHGLANRETGKGPWLKAHYSAAWKKLSPEQKAEYGMVNLADPLALAKTCAGCHVGAADRDLNHDLMAAGHPRLTFEASVFRANLPPHWNEAAKRKDRGEGYETRLWAVGKAATTRASLELLKHRATKAKEGAAPWPEFAEYGCFACHADLQHPSWRRDHPSGRAPGSLPYNRWNSVFVSVLESNDKGQVAEALSKVASAMEQPNLDPEKIRELAGEGVARLDELLLSAPRGPLALVRVRELATRLAALADKAEAWSWDEMEQAALAAGACQADLAAASREKQRLRVLYQKLAWPTGYESPHGYRPDPALLKDLRDLLHDLGQAR
jgi:hypothetical protein